ncbi:MAG: hypothetical protein ACJAUP_000070 [Cellvibrionaceae bacterium]
MAGQIARDDDPHCHYCSIALLVTDEYIAYCIFDHKITFVKAVKSLRIINYRKLGRKEMPDKIDYKFLSDLQGGSKKQGYVPAAGVSKSGVTIATGFDLGQRKEEEADLTGLGLSGTLVTKLKPYLGKNLKTLRHILKRTLSLLPQNKPRLLIKR